MKNKHQSKREFLRKRRARQRQVRRIVTISLVVLFILGVAWIIYSALQPDGTAPVDGLTIGGPTPELVGTKQYSHAPPFSIDTEKRYLATVTLAKGGSFVIELYADKAPITVNNFIFLARDGYYDGVTFHRVIDGFMAQAGDPTGTGGGGPGYTFANEVNDLEYDRAGVVGMANTGYTESNGSQFFILFNAYGLSESDYTIFGQVIEGMDVVDGITRRDPEKNPDFPGDAIEMIEITEE
jgi:cyclophilin family peptidyl-prolyl cis-trans isomerase